MNHGEVKKFLADYLEGDLALEDRAIVDAHLDQCAECSREVTEMEQTIRLLRLMPEPETPPMIAANVMRRIRAGESRPGLGRRVLGKFSAVFEPSFMLPASAIAAAAFVVMVAQGPGGLAGFGAHSVRDFFAPANAPRVESENAIARAPKSQTARIAGLEAFDTALPSLVANSARPAGHSNSLSNRLSGGGRAVSGRRAESDSVAARRRITIDFDVRANTQPRTVFSDPVLAPMIPDSLISDVYVANGAAGERGQGMQIPGAATLVRGRFGNNPPGAVNVSQTLSPAELGEVSGGGEDPRDAWLAKGLERPVDFARFLGGKTLAEQELWVARLSQRAEARGLLGELVLVLQGSGDEAASWLAKDFLAQAGRLDVGAGEAMSERFPR